MRFTSLAENFDRSRNKIPNTKKQIPNKFQTTMIKAPNLPVVADILFGA